MKLNLFLWLLANALANMIMADPQQQHQQSSNSYSSQSSNGLYNNALGSIARSPPRQSRRRPQSQPETHQNFFKRLQQSNNNRFGVPPDGLCAVDSDCAGYPMSYCDGVCKCISGALNAGSTCVTGGPAFSSATCSSGQIYVAEAGSCMTSQQPGEPCQYSQQCSANEPGAFCLKLRCECVYGMQQSGAGCTFVDSQCPQRGFIWISELGACKEVIPPGGKGCSHNLQCQAAYPDAACFLQTCSCPPDFPIAIDGTCGRNCSSGMTYSGVTGQCLPTVQPGDQCLYSSQCHAIHPGMICDRNRCTCSNGQVFSGNQCTDACPQGYRVNSKGVCAQGCAPTQIDFQGECLNQATPGQSCLVNAQCIGGSSCQSGVCMCPIAMVASGGACMPVQSPPLASCANGEQCSGGSFCISGNCSCPLGQSVLNGQCVTPIAVDIGSACVRVGVTCGGGSICVSGYCVCPLGTLPHHGKCVEHMSARAGESCANGEDCTGGAQCNQHSLMCECTNPLQIIIGGRCENRLRSHPGYPCSNGEVCVGGSECVSGKCECTNGRVNINKQCVYRADAKPGMSCGNGERCTGNAECDPSTKKCSCPRGMQSIEDVCTAFTFVGPGESCLALSSRCGGQSYCVRGTCQCAENMVPLNGKCTRVKHALPGSRCSPTENCVGRSVCREGNCACMNPLVLNRNRCETPRNVHPGESCRQGDHCLANASCRDGRCQCPLGQIVRNGRCEARRMIRPNFLCTKDDVCIGFSTCQNGICSCPADQTVVDDKCVEATNALPGQECGRNVICSGGSKCLEGMCVCGTDQRIYGNRCQDVIRVGPDASCSNGEVCTGGSSCDRKHRICRCPLRQFARQGKCVPIVVEIDPGMSCAEGEHCRYGSNCIDGMCVCQDGLILSQDNKCLPPISDLRLRPPPSRNETLLTECPTDGSCKLPGCFCSRSGTVIPGGLNPKETPQMIVLTFDDPVTDRTINIYKSLFDGRIRNPNSCPIKGTFFISHQWNNYDQAQWLYSRGNEIGLNSITHETLTTATEQRWRNEMVGLRESLKEFSYVDQESIQGVRAPQLLIGGDNQFEMMKEAGFVYDNSMPLRGGPYWPQTLDHKLAWDCEEQNCPTKPFKGLWELPINQMISTTGKYSAMARSAIRPFDNRDSVANMLKRNFLRHYKGNRAPFVITADTDFLTILPDNGAVNGLADFLNDVLNRTDVYVVTGAQAIEWMRRPTKVSEIERFQPWQCQFLLNDHVQPCESPSVCSYSASSIQGGVPHSFRVCGSCPLAYPWIENPLGKRLLSV